MQNNVLNADVSHMYPAAEGLRCMGADWADEIQIQTVARCLVYNAMEAAPQWHDAVIDWPRVASTESGWWVPCHIPMPHVGSVIRFELHGKKRPELNAMELSIPAEGLVEVDPSLARLMRIDLLPGFAAASAGEEGYLFLPNMTGVLHYFNHHVSREHRQTLYSDQSQWPIRNYFNCIGMNRANNAWCALVLDGEMNAEVVVRSHYEESVTYSVHFGLVYRWEADDKLIKGDRSVRYYLLSPYNGGWVGFAHCYRDFLREERHVKTWAQKADADPRVMKFARGFTMKVMQGYKQSSFDGQGVYQSATAFDEARQIFRRMQDDGIQNITAQMVGWNFQGHDGTYPTRFPVNEFEGGEKAFKELIAWGHQNHVTVTVHDNCLDSYQIANDFKMENVIEHRNGTRWRSVPWAGGFNWKLCPCQSFEYVRRDLPRMRELGIDGNYYFDAVGPFYTCHDPLHPADRSGFVDAVRKMLAYARNMFGTLSLELAYGTYFDLVDGVYFDQANVFIDKHTDYRRHIIDEQVPFLSIVLHNSVRCHWHNEQALQGVRGALRTLAWGMMPFIEISARPVAGAHAMPRYEDLSQYAQKAYAMCCQEYVHLVEVDMVDIEQPLIDVYRTSYADGTQLLVNCTPDRQKVDGKLIPGHSVRQLG